MKQPCVTWECSEEFTDDATVSSQMYVFVCVCVCVRVCVRESAHARVCVSLVYARGQLLHLAVFKYFFVLIADMNN